MCKDGKPQEASPSPRPHGKWLSFKTCETHGLRGLRPQHFFDRRKPRLRMRAAVHLIARHIKFASRYHRRTVQTQVTNMAKCERKVHSPQWRVHRPRQGLPPSQPSLRSFDNHVIFVAEYLTRTESETGSSLEGTRQNQQILASSFNELGQVLPSRCL